MLVAEVLSKDLKPRDIIRGATALATYWYLSGKALLATEMLYKKAKDKAVHLAQKAGEILSKESVILKTAEGFEAKIGHDVAENLSKMAAEHIAKSAYNKDLFEKYFDQIQKIHTNFNECALKPMSKKDLKHILMGHIHGGQEAIVGQKSIFDRAVNIVDIMLEGWIHGELISPGIKVYDAKRIIGTTTNGMPASKIKIVLNGTMDAIGTMFPI